MANISTAQNQSAIARKKINLSITSQNVVSKFKGQRMQIAAKGLDEESDRDFDDDESRKENREGGTAPKAATRESTTNNSSLG